LEGKLGESYKCTLQGKVVAEVLSQENTRIVAKGSLTRIMNIQIDAVQNSQLILAAIVVIGLISP